MKSALLWRVLAFVAVLVVAGWIVSRTEWIETEADDPARGAAATDRFYGLRALLKAAGTTLETPRDLSTLPPTTGTLVLDSPFWDLFPERDAQIESWVRAGGHLVLSRAQLRDRDRERLRWVPLRPAETSRPRPGASAASTAASSAEEDDDEEDDSPAVALPPLGRPARRAEHCRETYVESPGSVPAFEPGRVFHGCLYSGDMRPRAGVAPTWQLLDGPASIALRLPLGRGQVTVVEAWQLPWPLLQEKDLRLTPGVLDTRSLLFSDHALVITALLDARPGRAIWITEREAGEPLPAWLWHHARAALLLALAALVLSLWRLGVRFGPRELGGPAVRRSAGEQVRGTGAFIAATEPEALHAATRHAFDAMARTRVPDWDALDDDEARARAIADHAGPGLAVDPATLLRALRPAPAAPPAAWIAAIATLEQARRALARH